MEISVDIIQPSPYQPRLIFNLEDLQEEIKKDGLLNDLVIRKRGKYYELIDGERRWRTLKKLGWKTVPARVIKANNEKARLLVYKLNKIRENYTIEEEARYFKKLRDEGLNSWDISKHVNVDYHWVLAHLNIFKFPEEIQQAVWTKQISISHLVTLEKVIGRNIKEAIFTVNEILKRKLNVSETKKIVNKREKELKTRVKEMRIKEVEKVLPTIASNAPKLEKPEDFEEAAKILTKKAEEMRKDNLTFEKIEEAEKHLSNENIETNLEATSIQSVWTLRDKIEALEKEKERLLETKGFLTKALSFNCPHCNNACIVYREGDTYWVE